MTGPNGEQADAQVIVHVGQPPGTTSGGGLGNSSAAGSGTGGSGTGKGGTGGGTNTGGKSGTTQPRPKPKPATKPPVRPAAPGAGAAKARQAPGSPGSPQAVRGVLLADAGSPFDLRLSPPPPSGSPGAALKSAGGASGLGPVVGGLALAAVIAGLGALRERRRGMLRPA